ncbi:Arginine deiminase [Streptococcus pneumoniae]|nr:Arginine deiminase [Streptococcus pneumoniae]CIW29701.1 Arginine deiminase [Streptococcus pneumoniae]CIW41142.1 Arginine deiminase [Streptococcus pneumoniae]CIW63074.1 Arginine deiminase [Streptococcus pneumoniae]
MSFYYFLFLFFTFSIDRNTVTNKILEEYGLRLIKIRGSELVRGRGGPRCMSMPFEREEV